MFAHQTMSPSSYGSPQQANIVIPVEIINNGQGHSEIIQSALPISDNASNRSFLLNNKMLLKQQEEPALDDSDDMEDS